MNLLVTSSPHIHSGRTTSRLMADVLIALIPAVLAGFYFFGLRAAILMVVSIASCKIAEFLWCAVRRQPHTLRDCSAAVTGLLFDKTVAVARHGQSHACRTQYGCRTFHFGSKIKKTPDSNQRVTCVLHGHAGNSPTKVSAKTFYSSNSTFTLSMHQ